MRDLTPENMRMVLRNLNSLNSEEREALAIIAQTDLITHEMLESDALAKSLNTSILSLASKNLIEIEKEVSGIRINIDPKLAAHLHLEFLQLPLSRRRKICLLIAEDLKSRSKIIEMLEVLNHSGDKRLFTDSILNNAIEITSNHDAHKLNYLASQMLIENPLEAFAQETFKVAASIWSGNYLQALDQLDSLEILSRNGFVAKELEPTIPLLKFFTTYHMGRPISSMEYIKQFLEYSLDEIVVQQIAVLQAAKVLASHTLLTLNQSTLDEALALANKAKIEGLNHFGKYISLQIEAIELFVRGDLKGSREKAEIVVEQAQTSGYDGIQCPLDSLYILACYWEEQLENDLACEYWSKILNESISSNLPMWRCIALVRLAKCQNFLNPFVDVNEAISEARKFYGILPYRQDLDIVVDIEELIFSYQKNNVQRCEVLLLRIPKNTRCEEIHLALEAKGNNFAKNVLQMNPNSPRQKIYQLLYLSQKDDLGDEQRNSYLREALKLCEKYGYKRIMALQTGPIASSILLVASEGEVSFYEDLVRTISSVTHNRLSRSTDERIALTSKEREILALLSGGFGREEICKQMSISLNTLKTHQKNLYKKLEAGSRNEAVYRAKKLGLLTS